MSDTQPCLQESMFLTYFREGKSVWDDPGWDQVVPPGDGEETIQPDLKTETETAERDKETAE